MFIYVVNKIVMLYCYQS